jgi:hypothetical protein
VEDQRREVSEEAPRFIVRIEGVDGKGKRVHGTGFFITERGHVATCLHVVDKLTAIHVKHPYEAPWKYSIVSRDVDRDLAILAGTVRPNFAPPTVTLAQSKAFRTAEPLRFYGWSDTENYTAPRSKTCTFAAYSERNGLIGLNANADPGDSGGPVLDERNEVVALIRVRDQERTGHALAIPVEALRALVGSLVVQARENRPPPPALLNRLLALPRPEFERLLLLAAVPQHELPPYGAGHDARARAAVSFLDLETVQTITVALAGDASLGAMIRERLWTLVAHIASPLYDAVPSRWIGEPVERRALDDYHADLARRMKEENAVQLIEQNVAVGDSAESDPFSMKVRRGSSVQRIRHLLRSLSGVSRGGDQASAQIASLHRRSRVVRDAVATLLHTEQPVILLGEPGSGKSMTLREVARDLVRRKNAGPRPPVVIYARLGTYRTVEDDAPGDIVEFIRSQIPPQYESIRNALPTFIAEGRLIVLFDGMDEMERRRYNERVRQLSSFASDYEKSVKTLFSCRINDFTPEFAHHQLVLLPFGDSQVAEFARKNVWLPLTIDGVSYTRHAHFARDLRLRPGLSELVNNPLMLFLTCEYVIARERWPRTRAALYRNYIEQHLASMEEAKRIAFTGGEPDALFAAWAALGFDLINGGAADAATATLDPRAVDIGTRAGLLQLDPDDDGRVRFTHHRFKEYFAASHISSLPPGSIDWKAMLDEAGWQETLLNLASINPQEEALEELRESIAEGVRSLRSAEAPPLSLLYVPPPLPPLPPPSSKKVPQSIGEVIRSLREESSKKLSEMISEVRSNMGSSNKKGHSAAPAWLEDSEGERRLAERVVLASHVIREITAERAVLPHRFESDFHDALEFLARSGRPTSQVKMLWAWKNAPGPNVAEALSTPMNSAISWVRDQAIILVGSVSGTDLSQNLGIELAKDLAAERVLDRLPTYRRAARGSRRWTLAVLAAAFSHAGILATSAAVSAALVAASVMSSWPYSMPSLTITSGFILLVSLACLGAPMLQAEWPVGTARCLIGASGIVAIGWTALWLVVREGLVPGWSVGFMLLFTLMWLPGLIAEAVFWPFALFFAAALNMLFSPRTRSIALRVFRSSPAVRTSWELTRPTAESLAIGAASLLVSLGVTWLWPAFRDLLEQSVLLAMLFVAKWSVLAVPATLTAVYFLLHPFPRLKRVRHLAKATLGSVGQPAAVLAFLIWGQPPLRRFSEYLMKTFGGGWPLWITTAVIALLPIALAIVIARHYTYVFKGVLIRARRRIPVEEWRERMTLADPTTQRQYLRIERSQFEPHALTAAEYLNLLCQVESAVESEPAAAEYWRQRQQMEQAVRQDRRGD